MIQKHFENIVLEKFGFEFSITQKKALEAFLHFFFSMEENGAFLLRGYAGTGKTSLVSAVVETLLQLKYKVVLLAPTGRAAKVFSSYAGTSALTIHKKIYRQKSATDGEEFFNLAFNGGAETLYFVDEASMISNVESDGNFGSGHLLDDLIEFVYNGKRNRLVLIGDVTQLPPIGLTISPALNKQTLEDLYGLQVTESHLTDIMRQAEQSGILYNATQIRNIIGTTSVLQLKVKDFPDVFRISGEELLEALDTCYGKYGEEETIIVCRSNKRANRFNEGVRRTILYREEDVCKGDRMMIVKNNYFWVGGDEKIDFIANGDMATIKRVGKRMELYGFHFLKVDLKIDSYEEELSVWVILDTLQSDSPALTYEQNRALYRSIEQDYLSITSKKKRFEAIRSNEFYNALQVKFSYAITCHKAQGGQWDAVFIDQGYVPQEQLDDDYWRWLYTAITRARKQLYFINFQTDFFED